MIANRINAATEAVYSCHQRARIASRSRETVITIDRPGMRRKLTSSSLPSTPIV